MAREDALALLDTFRLDREAPPECKPEQLARRYVQLLFPERRFFEEAANRVQRSP